MSPKTGKKLGEKSALLNQFVYKFQANDKGIIIWSHHKKVIDRHSTHRTSTLFVLYC